MKGKSESEVAVMSDSATPWTAAYQAPLSVGFSRQEYWSGVPLPNEHFFHLGEMNAFQGHFLKMQRLILVLMHTFKC